MLPPHAMTYFEEKGFYGSMLPPCAMPYVISENHHFGEKCFTAAIYPLVLCCIHHLEQRKVFIVTCYHLVLCHTKHVSSETGRFLWQHATPLCYAIQDIREKVSMVAMLPPWASHESYWRKVGEKKFREEVFTAASDPLALHHTNNIDGRKKDSMASRKGDPSGSTVFYECCLRSTNEIEGAIQQRERILPYKIKDKSVWVWLCTTPSGYAILVPATIKEKDLQLCTTPLGYAIHSYEKKESKILWLCTTPSCYDYILPW